MDTEIRWEGYRNGVRDESLNFRVAYPAGTPDSVISDEMPTTLKCLGHSIAEAVCGA